VRHLNLLPTEALAQAIRAGQRPEIADENLAVLNAGRTLLLDGS